MIAVYKLSSQAVFALNEPMIGAELIRCIALDEIVSEPLPAESTAVTKNWYRFRGVKTSSVCSINNPKPFEA